MSTQYVGGRDGRIVRHYPMALENKVTVTVAATDGVAIAE